MIIIQNTNMAAMVSSGFITLLVAIIAPLINRFLLQGNHQLLRRWVVRRIKQRDRRIAALQQTLKAEHHRQDDDRQLIEDLSQQIAADQDSTL